MNLAFCWAPTTQQKALTFKTYVKTHSPSQLQWRRTLKRMSSCCHVEVSTPSRRDTFICSVSMLPVLNRTLVPYGRVKWSYMLYVNVYMFIVISDIVVILIWSLKWSVVVERCPRVRGAEMGDGLSACNDTNTLSLMLCLRTSTFCRCKHTSNYYFIHYKHTWTPNRFNIILCYKNINTDIALFIVLCVIRDFQEMKWALLMTLCILNV